MCAKTSTNTIATLTPLLALATCPATATRQNDCSIQNNANIMEILDNAPSSARPAIRAPRLRATLPPVTK